MPVGLFVYVQFDATLAMVPFTMCRSVLRPLVKALMSVKEDKDSENCRLLCYLIGDEHNGDRPTLTEQGS